MKTTTQYLSSLALALALATSGAIAAELAPAKAESTDTGKVKAGKPGKPGKEAARAEKKAARKEAKKAGAAADSKPAESAAAPVAPPAPPEPAEKAELHLNFRNAPLDLVLNYMSEAAGYIIVLETSVRGTIDVWSNTPVTKAEALGLLNSALNKNNYAAILEGRTLTILSKSDAKTRENPIVVGSEAVAIPKDEQIVTQIIPVKGMSASSLIRDISSLIPSTATVTANEGGNSLIMTDTRRNVRRVVEIVQALDGLVAGAASIKVFALKFADAKALATTIKELFPDTTGAAAAGGRGGRGGGGGGGGGIGGFGGFPGFGGGGGTATGSSSGSSRNSTTATKVGAVADEFSNSLIVTASESQLKTIETLIKSVDTDQVDLTEIRVFALLNADPTETADQITKLFPDTTSSSQNTGGRGGGFGGFGGPGGIFGGGGAARTGGNGATSDRSKKMGKVIAVAEPRTQSLIVSAAKEMMPQIEAMVKSLDLNPAKKHKIITYNLENANITEVEAVLRAQFEAQNSRNTQNNNQQNALTTRQNQANQTTRQGLTSGFGQGAGRGN